MKKLLLALLLLGLASSQALAQTVAPVEPPSPMAPNAPAAAAAPGNRLMQFGIDLQLAIPIFEFYDVAGVGLGALAKFQFALTPYIALTARAGYVRYLEKSGITNGSIPLLVGAKYYVVPGAYAAAEVGLSDNRFSATVAGNSISDSDLDFMWTIGIGYEVANVGPGTLDLRASFQMLNTGGSNNNGEQLAFSVGYNFISF